MTLSDMKIYFLEIDLGIQIVNYVCSTGIWINNTIFIMGEGRGAGIQAKFSFSFFC